MQAERHTAVTDGGRPGAPPTAAGGPPRGRLLGVDAARGVAILGMLVAHVADDGTRNGLADGRSSVLFATAAGISLGLLTGGPVRPTGAAGRRALIRIALRGVLLLVLGLSLWRLGTPVAVILDYYGVLFLVLLPVVLAPRWVLLAVAVTAALAGPLVIAAVGEDLRTPFTAERPSHLLTEWFVTGYYPGVVWAAYLAAGLLAARLDLAQRRTQLVLLVGGAGACVVGYGGAGLLGQDASAHANSTGEVLGSGGLALAVVAVLQLACSARATSEVAPRVLHPLIAAGAMPLTIYTSQLIVIALFLMSPAAGDPPSMASWPLLAALVIGSLLFATAWRRFAGQGPLESVMAALTAAGPPARRPL